MEEKESIAKESLEYTLDRLLRILLEKERAYLDDTSLVREQKKIYASPEEGARLIRAFVRIKQPERRAVIIELATQMAHLRLCLNPVQN